MRRTTLAPIVLALISAASVACSRSPVSPTAVARQAENDGTPMIAESSSAEARAMSGSYQLQFLDSSLQPITVLPVSDGELILGAHVTDGAGNPAQGGRVIFEYCSLKGAPPHDITRPDEAPLSACADGSATWASLAGIDVNQAGNAYLDFGVVLIPRTVGFRYRYLGQGSGVANGVSSPADFTWVAQP
jgi:hypothetical protein